MFDLTPPPGIPGVLWTIFAFVGAFGILGALVWVNVLIGGLVNAMFMLLAGPLIDKLLKTGLWRWVLTLPGLGNALRTAGFVETV